MSGVRLSEAEFLRLAALLERAAGLVFDESRRDSLGFTVAERLRATGCPDVPSYLDLLADAGELQELLDAVTIPETHFFRNPPQVRALRRHVLPELLARAARRGRRLRVWSAGCATGEEAYTLAMLIREQLADPTGWDVKILGTDISGRALQVAQAATYGTRSIVMTEPADLNRWFERDGERYTVRSDIRALVDLRRHNLVTEPPPFGPDELDLVLCRNVTIYFGRDTTRELVGRLHEVTSEGGYLFLGHAETLWQVSEAFRLVELGDAYVYRRDAPSGERRRVLPDRRASDDGPPPAGLGPDRRIWARRIQPVGVDLVEPAADREWPGMPEPREPGVEELLGDARAALGEGDYELASERARAAGQLAPMRGEAWYLAGVALVNARRDEEALTELRKATYADPGAGFSHFVLGGVLSRLRHDTAAALAYRTAADTLGRPGDEAAPELGGRTLPELVALCHQLADALEGQQPGI